MKSWGVGGLGGRGGGGGGRGLLSMACKAFEPLHFSDNHVFIMTVLLSQNNVIHLKIAAMLDPHILN